MNKGYVIFNGGEAFDSAMYEADRAWIKYVRHSNRRPRVIVVPVAAMDKHQKIAYETCKYFSRMGAQTDYKLITTPLLANTRIEYEVLHEAEIVVLSDGSPIDMIERLKGTHAEKALTQMTQRKAALYGTGASAMALGSVYWFAHEWLPGMGIVPQIAVLPHYNLIAGRLSTEKLLADLPDGVTLVGLDQRTNLVAHPDNTFEVLGQGSATVYRSVKKLDTYEHGQTFRLDTPDKTVSEADDNSAR